MLAQGRTSRFRASNHPPSQQHHPHEQMPLSRRAVTQLTTMGLLGSSLGWPAAAISSPRWSYRGKEGPEHWGELSTDYRLCNQGTHQSPIDLETLTPTTVKWSYDYRPSQLTLTHNGHTIRADSPPGSTLTLENEVFELLQFHFHDPSEHTQAQQHQPMEIHFVHRHPQTRALAVLGVLVKTGPSNIALSQLWQALPEQVHQSTSLSQPISAAQLLPTDSTQAFRYRGSLTTPPCSEDVTWLVLANPVTASTAQIERFKALIGTNARPTQQQPTQR
ncbi:MAG: carbonic anhydrase family protein [Cyanobacteria bacterium J06632_22]